jgi:hypothetical protein
MLVYKKECVEAELQALIADIRVRHTAAIAADSCYDDDETLGQWVLLEVTTLQTMVRDVQSMRNEQLALVWLFLFLEHSAIWIIKERMLFGTTLGAPLHFPQDYSASLMKTFRELVTVLSNVTTPERGAEYVAAAVDRFKETLAYGVAFILSCRIERVNEWVIPPDKLKWPTRDQIASFF